jgi:hypothetical protein
MDCKTARMLLEFSRPQAHDLDETDRADIAGHLAHCPDCDEFARAEQRVDQHIGKAMRQVEVPDRLLAAIRNRLAQESRRQRLRKYCAGIAAAAAVLIAAIGLYIWQSWHLPSVDIQSVWDRTNQITYTRTPISVRGEFSTLGVDVDAPLQFNYALLSACSLGDFQGKRVPQLTFTGQEASGQRQVAEVYLLSDKVFDLKSLRQYAPPMGGYTFNVEVRYEEGSSQAIVIFHTGREGDLSWLTKQDQVGNAEMPIQ